MDWILSVTTLLVNSGLGWTRGRPWMWLLHALNAVGWIAYALMIKQRGLVLLAVVTIVVDLISAWRAMRVPQVIGKALTDKVIGSGWWTE